MFEGIRTKMAEILKLKM